MPIIGLSEKRRITRGGYLRLGKKAVAQNGKEYPTKIDHFEPDFENEEHARIFRELYGEKPKRITISFHSDDTETIFSQWFKAYGKSTGLKCKGDGATAVRFDDEGGSCQVECPGPDECAFARQNASGGKGCKPIGSLQFFIKGVPGLQIFQINTTSWNSIVNVNSGIELLQFVRQGRSIAGVWIDLMLVPHEGKAKGKRVEVFVLKLDIPVSLDNVLKLTSSFEVAPTDRQLPASDAKDPMLYPENGYAPDDDDGGEVGEEVPEAEMVEEGGGGLATDPEVVAAFEATNASSFKRAKMIESAERHGWDKASLLRAIVGGNNPRAKGQSAPAPVPAPAPIAAAVGAEEDFDY